MAARKKAHKRPGATLEPVPDELKATPGFAAYWPSRAPRSAAAEKQQAHDRKALRKAAARWLKRKAGDGRLKDPVELGAVWGAWDGRPIFGSADEDPRDEA